MTDTTQPSVIELTDEALAPSNIFGEPSTSEFTDEQLAALDEQPTQTTEPDEYDPTTQEGFSKFNEQFKQYAGYDFKDALAEMRELRQWRSEQVVQRQQAELQQAWQVEPDELNSRLEAVRERFKTLPPQLQSSLNNPQGAQLIWAKIQQEQTKQVPTLERSTQRSTNLGNNYKFTRKEIRAMPSKEYAARLQEINYAYANGLVLNN